MNVSSYKLHAPINTLAAKIITVKLAERVFGVRDGCSKNTTSKIIFKREKGKDVVGRKVDNTEASLTCRYIPMRVSMSSRS